MVFLDPVTNKGLEDDPNNALSPSAFFVPLKQAYQFERSLLLQLNGLSEWHFVLLKWSLSLRLNGTLCAVALEENSHSGAQLLARNLGSGIGFVEFWEGSGVAFTDPAVTVDSRAKSLSLCVFFFFYLSVPGSLSWKKPSPGSAECFLTASRRPPCQCGRARPRHRSLLTGHVPLFWSVQSWSARFLEEWAFSLKSSTCVQKTHSQHLAASPDGFFFGN